MAFDVILMNPPWTLKQGGKVTEKSTWRKFADAALKLAETVVVVAPMTAKKCDKKILVSAVRFDGVDHDGCVVVWSEDQRKSVSCEEKFDLHFDVFFSGGSGSVRADANKAQNTVVPVENWTGKRFWSTETYALRCGFYEEKLMMRFKKAGKHDARRAKGLLAMCTVVKGPAEEAQRFLDWANSETGIAVLVSLAGTNNGGFLNINAKTLNAAFSSRHQK